MRRLASKRNKVKFAKQSSLSRETLWRGSRTRSARPADTAGRACITGMSCDLFAHRCQWQKLCRQHHRTFDRSCAPGGTAGAISHAARPGAGYDVAFVTEGDPLLYSTFGYVLEAVKRDYSTIPIEVVPGVSSITAAAAAAALPLAAWDE